MGLGLEGGDQVVQTEAAAAARFQHVAKRGVEHFRSIAILKSVEEKKALGSQDGRVFSLAGLRLCGNCMQHAADDFRASFGAAGGFAAASGGKSRQRGERRLLLEESGISAVAEPTCGQGGCKLARLRQNSRILRARAAALRAAGFCSKNPGFLP